MTATDTINRLVTRGLNDEPPEAMYDDLPDDMEELKNIIAGLLGHIVCTWFLYAGQLKQNPQKMWSEYCLFRELKGMR